MHSKALLTAAAGGPAIVCAQAGEVNSGAVDPLSNWATTFDDVDRSCAAVLYAARAATR